MGSGGDAFHVHLRRHLQFSVLGLFLGERRCCPRTDCPHGVQLSIEGHCLTLAPVPSARWHLEHLPTNISSSSSSSLVLQEPRKWWSSNVLMLWCVVSGVGSVCNCLKPPLSKCHHADHPRCVAPAAGAQRSSLNSIQWYSRPTCQARQNQPFSADHFYVFSSTAQKVRRCRTFESASVALACLVVQRALDWLSDILTFVHVCGSFALFSDGCQYRSHTRLGRRPCGRMRFPITGFEIPNHVCSCNCRTILNLSKKRRFRVCRGCVSHCAAGVSTSDGSSWVDSFLVLADVQGLVQATSVSQASPFCHLLPLRSAQW